MKDEEVAKQTFVQIGGNYIRQDQILIGDFSEYERNKPGRCAKIVVDVKADPYRLFNEAADDALDYFQDNSDTIEEEPQPPPRVTRRAGRGKTK